MFAALAVAMVPASVHAAQAANFTLINKTGMSITGASIRRSGSSAWKALGGGISNGARTSISFSDPDCAFDIQVKFGDGQTAIYGGVNLCDVKSVTLNRSAGGNPWVEYD